MTPISDRPVPADAADDGWTTRELADRINRGDPEAACEVIREMARRLASRADNVADPRTVVLDLGHALDDIAGALATVLDWVTDTSDDTDRRRVRDMVAQLVNAADLLDEIAQGWI
jgi:tRNA C32,U32 (ribose-2'-O)-methylase TrmJ